MSSRAVTVLTIRVVAVAVPARRVLVDHPHHRGTIAWSTGDLLHPSDGWEWDLLLPGSCRSDFTPSEQKLEATPEFGSRRDNREQRGQVVSEAQDELETSQLQMCCPSLFSPWLLFVCQAPGCDSPFSPRVFASVDLWGEVHLLLGDKTRSRDGKSSFQGKHDISMEKYLCVLFLILKLCLGMLPWTLKSELALMLSRFYPPFLYNF